MNPKVQRLLNLLTYRRPDATQTEELFVHKFIECYPHTKYGPMENIVIVVPGDDETLFSCHTDTVHHKEGIQKVLFDSDLMYAYKDDGEVLGADDGTGVWLMLEMIDAKVPGTYIFHRGEERGGIGSDWMAENMPEWLKKFKRAIAFDRKGEDSVITCQSTGVCCSDDFGHALAHQLGLGFKVDETGIFTDTANYTHLIPECTNLSVGYYEQHTKGEMQNVQFALDLLEVLQKVDWRSLPTARTPKKENPYDFAWDGYPRLATSKAKLPKRKMPQWIPLTLDEAVELRGDDATFVLEELVYESPEIALDILIEALNKLDEMGYVSSANPVPFTSFDEDNHEAIPQSRLS